MNMWVKATRLNRLATSLYGGEEGIRTLASYKLLSDFKSDTFIHLVTSPYSWLLQPIGRVNQ